MQASGQSQRSSSANILVVEDDEDTLELLRTVLEREGYSVATASGGKNALARLQESPFDLVLSDVSMAEGDGFTLVSSLRELGLLDVPVILMSAEHESTRRVASLDVGADDFVAKPFDLNELLARLRAQLRRVGRQMELARESLLDPLTHVLNRRGFDELFTSHAALLRRRPGALSLLMIDLDDFKSINDQHGHAVGDEVLVEVSNVLSRAVRASDRVGRMGGDEFAILMPEANLDVARALADRLHALSPVPVRTGGKLNVTASFSIGAATAHAAEPLAVLLARADLAMYGEKRRRLRDQHAS